MCAEITNRDPNKEFEDLRIQAADLLFRAACLPGVTNKLAWAQVKAASRIAAMDIKPMPKDAKSEDFLRLSRDMREIAQHADDLIQAFGFEAAIHDHNIDQSLFKEQLFGALDGNAFYDLECAAERLDPEADPDFEDTCLATAGDMKREFWSA